MTGKNRLPRLDLHCHLDGSLSQGCIEELLGRSVKLEELQADMDCQSLGRVLWRNLRFRWNVCRQKKGWSELAMIL